MAEQITKGYTPEKGAKLKVLEIGSGRSPAIEEGGSLFQNNNVLFVAADIPSWWVGRTPNDTQPKPDYPFIFANAAHLPVCDESLDYVLMRNVFGQFEDDYPVSNIDDVRTWGLQEVFRALKPGGHIVTVEESTPWENRYVEGYFESSGFEPVAYEHISDTFDPDNINEKWQKLRQVFYGTSDMNHGDEYILIGQKPVHSEAAKYPYKTEEVDIYSVPATDTRVTGTMTLRAEPYRETGDLSHPWLEDAELIASGSYKRGPRIEKPSIITKRNAGNRGWF